MRNRKVLITVALIVIMLLNCIAPMLEAQAATAKTTMTFNVSLYQGLKAYFQEQGIKAVYNDALHTIKMETAKIQSLEELSLKEKGISDLTGLDVFSGVKRLILSGNDIDENSNLSVLNNFSNLIYLDISSNQISDISSIQGLVERLIALDSNAINLTSQNAKIVVDVPLDINEQKTEVEYTLPQILQTAGKAENGTISNRGILKSDWINYGAITSNNSNNAPYLKRSTIPNPVTAQNNKFTIQVGYNHPDSYEQYEGLVKIVINIKDTSTASYNVNPAALNVLKDSIFTLYYVVHTDASEGIIFKDSNFYYAVKRQLTKEQTINSELLSYKYEYDSNGEIYYDLCDVTLSGTTALLKINGTQVYKITNFNMSGYDNRAVIYKGTSLYEIQNYEVVYVPSVGNDGTVTTSLKVKIPHYNEETRNLYIDAYDEALSLVISDLDIVNKITSLILNDQRIEDLSGLEKFVGLKSNLNVSYNYIESLEKIYGLELNKEASNADLRKAFVEKKTGMANAKGELISAYNSALDKVKAIKAEIAKETEAREAAAALDSTAENYSQEVAKCAEKIAQSEKAIYGDGTEENIGLVGELNRILDTIQVNLPKVYSRLSSMYTIFNNEYKLTTLLTPELNGQATGGYEALEEKMNTLEGAKALLKDEFNRLSSFEAANALSEFEQNLIVTGLNIHLADGEEKPIAKALDQLYKDLEDEGAPRYSYVRYINIIREIDIYSQATNYCLLRRMNTSSAPGKCYAEEYLEKRLEDDYDGADLVTVKAIYEQMVNGSTELTYNGTLYSLFEEYEDEYRVFSRDYPVSIMSRLFACENSYSSSYEATITALGKAITTGNSSTLGSYTRDIRLTEYDVRNLENSTDTYFFNQLLTLANKFTTVDETSIYVTLPALKRIDVRNNQIETLGDTTVTMVDKNGNKTTTTENLATLKNLKELYAGHNLLSGDIACVNWSALTALKKLDLSYNFITDILPLQVLKNLKYLDVSDNLLEGEFNLSLKEMENLEDVILAGNKYTDITKILVDYEMEAGGDFTAYFAREDTLNLDISRQELELDLTDKPIAFDSDSSIYGVELPPIFAQLEYIDAQRTAYGTTSSKGTIVAKGGTAYLPVSKNGEYVGIVKVIAANGYPEDVTTSIGIDTSCTIKYIVQNVSVSSVVINEDISRVERGTTATFTATVEGENVPDQTVEWDIEGNQSENTTISQDGVLTVAVDEPAEEIVIIATSNYDDTVEIRKPITLFTKSVTSVTVAGPDSIITGNEGQYEATMVSANLEDSEKGITWSISGNTSAETTISEEGVLTVAAGEGAESITVIATSDFDNTKFGTKSVVINKKAVTEVTVSPETEIVRTGKTATFTATVEGNFLEDSEKEVIWSVTGQESSNTSISQEGVLTVGADETSETLIVTATSKFDTTKAAISTVTIKVTPILPEMGYTVDLDGDIVGVSPDTASSIFKRKLVADESYTVTVTRDGNAILDTTSVATGDIVAISKDGVVVGTYEVVVKGDINCDGTVDVSDTRLIKSYRARITPLEGLSLKAADVDSDGDITVSDVRLILAHRAKIAGYIL